MFLGGDDHAAARRARRPRTSIGMASTDQRRMVVATETGGLFRTYDGGQSWQHLDGLPNYKTIDVAVASLAPDTIIATTQSQYRTINDGGIWRSTDGGGTWTQPTGWATPGPHCTDRPSAYGISHMPLSRTFYVGTDCGLAVSNDDGATWTNVIPDPNAAAGGTFINRVHSVLVINRTSASRSAIARSGIWTAPATGARIEQSRQRPDTADARLRRAMVEQYVDLLPRQRRPEAVRLERRRRDLDAGDRAEQQQPRSVRARCACAVGR